MPEGPVLSSRTRGEKSKLASKVTSNNGISSKVVVFVLPNTPSYKLVMSNLIPEVSISSPTTLGLLMDNICKIA